MNPLKKLIVLYTLAIVCGLCAAVTIAHAVSHKQKIAAVIEVSGECKNTLTPLKVYADESSYAAIENKENAENAVICLINREREKEHLSPVKRVRILTQVAREHNKAMVEKDFFSHDGPDGTLKERYERVNYFNETTSWAIGEIIFWAEPVSYATPAQAVKAWMASKGHREIILTPSFNEIGAAANITPQGWEGEAEGAVYTADFGKLS